MYCPLVKPCGPFLPMPSELLNQLFKTNRTEMQGQWMHKRNGTISVLTQLCLLEHGHDGWSCGSHIVAMRGQTWDEVSTYSGGWNRKRGQDRWFFDDISEPLSQPQAANSDFLSLFLKYSSCVFCDLQLKVFLVEVGSVFTLPLKSWTRPGLV